MIKCNHVECEEMAAYYISAYSIAGWTFPVAIIFIATGGYIIGADS